jgi:hypothetical protein
MKPKAKPWIKDNFIKCGSVCHFKKDTNSYKFQKIITKFDKTPDTKYKVEVKELPEEENALENSDVILEESNTISCQEKFQELCLSRKDFQSKKEAPQSCLQKLCKKFLCCITKN